MNLISNLGYLYRFLSKTSIRYCQGIKIFLFDCRSSEKAAGGTRCSSFIQSRQAVLVLSFILTSQNSFRKWGRLKNLAVRGNRAMVDVEGCLYEKVNSVLQPVDKEVS